MFLKEGDIVRIRDNQESQAYAGRYSGSLAVIESIDTGVSVTVRVKGSNQTFTIPNKYLELQIHHQPSFDDYINSWIGDDEKDEDNGVKCTCGGDKANLNHHYDWCAKAKK